MNFKLLDLLKSSNYTTEELQQIINSSYRYFYKNSFTDIQELKRDQAKQKIFSNLIRFYRSINSNKKIEEGLVLSNLKENIKNTTLIESLNEKVNEIISIQTTRFNYSDTFSSSRHFIRQSDINIKSKNESDLLTAIKSFKNLSYKLNVTVLNKDSNRVLTPQIILIFLLDGGEKITMQIDIKIFQELRRVLAYHIKKMIDNESVGFLRN